MPRYAFDVLPVHPQPERLESFTGYLTRLAEANGLTRYSDLAQRLFPGVHSLKVREMTDYPPESFGNLAREAICSERILRSTTFFHLARKFGRTPKVRSLSLLLVGAASRHLRYCPLCLAEYGYYQLPWRLLPLVGCPQHHCYLLDRCTGCGGLIRLLANNFRVGICPHCQADLRSSPTRPLPSEVQSDVQALSLELEFLLLPQPWESGTSLPAVAAGTAFERARRRTQQSANEVAAQMGMLRSGVRAIERGGVGLAGATFLRYLQYTRYLGVSFRQMFNDGLVHYEPLPDTLTYEEELEARLLRAVMHLQSTGEPVNDQTLRVWTGVCLKTLQSYPATQAVLHQLQVDAFYERETRLLKQVEATIQQLQAQGKPAYREDIYRIVGQSAAELKSYPRIRERLHALNRVSYTKKPTRFLRCEQTLLEEVQHIIQHLLDRGQPVTQEQVTVELGLSLQQIRRAYPRVKALLDDTQRIRLEQRENDLLTRVKQVIQTVHTNQHTVTRKRVAGLLNVCVETLSRYPAVRDHLKQACDQQIAAQKTQRAAAVSQAVDTLREQQQPLTQAAICHLAGLNESAPRHHLDLKTFIDPVLEAQQAEYEQHLLRRVTEAVTDLRQRGQRVTMPAVCQIVGMSLAGLRQHPQVVERVRCVRAEIREDYETQLVERIEQAVQQLQATGEPLTQKAICEVIAMSPNTLRYYHKAKTVVDAVAIRYHQQCHTPWHDRYQRPG